MEPEPSVLNLNLDAINDAANLTANVRSLPNIISTLIKVALPLSGIILLGVIIFAGFTIMTNAANPDKAEQGKKMLTQGIVGFLIIFAAYWIAQIIEVLTGFPIVSP